MKIKRCRVQLDIAAQAQQRSIALRVSGAEVAQSARTRLPPGILHTLIENSLIHAGFSACAELGFDLSIERSDKGIRLCLRAPLTSHRHLRREGDGDGTGTRFILASQHGLRRRAAGPKPRGRRRVFIAPSVLRARFPHGCGLSTRRTRLGSICARGARFCRQTL